MRKVLRDLFTGQNGQTFDLGRVLWAAAVTVILLAGFGQVVGIFARLFDHGQSLRLWNADEWGYWGAAVAVQLPAGGAALLLKAKTEPPA